MARAIVDSGADRTTVPVAWAPHLGIDLLHDCMEDEALTAAGSSQHYVFTDGVWVELLGEEVLIPVINFAPGSMVALGRNDFFDEHLVMIDQRGKRFFLESYPARKEDDPDDDDQFEVALAG